MDLHKEIAFENDICAHLGTSGWLYAEGDAAYYDRARALFPSDILAWVQETQPTAWEALAKSHGAAAEAVLLDRIRRQLDDRGTLAVLRHGVELLGLRQPLMLAQLKPALAMNPDLQARYGANRLRVVRQLRYSLHNENAIDLVLFLNGLPMATVELKTDFTQCVEDAVDQYRFDRHPRKRVRTSAGISTRGAGAFRRQQFRSPHDHQIAGRAYRLFALQSRRPWRCRKSGESLRPSDRIPVGRSLGKGQLAGNSGPPSGGQEGQQEADRRHHLPPLSPA